MTLHLRDTSPINSMINAERLDVAAAWNGLRDDDLEEAVRAAVIDFGGCYMPPCGEWGPLEHELSLLGLSATGETLAAAARSWIKRTHRYSEALQDANHTAA